MCSLFGWSYFSTSRSTIPYNLAHSSKIIVFVVLMKWGAFLKQLNVLEKYVCTNFKLSNNFDDDVHKINC